MLKCKFVVFSIALILILLAVSAACAESLWQPEKARSMYADRRAHKVGDIVTIVIVESAVSSQQASTDAKKDSKIQAGPGVGPLVDSIPLFKYSGGDSIKASGASTRTSKFVAKMTATVTKVLDNGNLEIQGSRLVQTNKDKEEMKLTGTIRPSDIEPGNTILSTYIADAKITHVGSGPVGSRQKEGLVSKILRILF